MGDNNETQTCVWLDDNGNTIVWFDENGNWSVD